MSVRFSRASLRFFGASERARANISRLISFALFDCRIIASGR